MACIINRAALKHALCHVKGTSLSSWALQDHVAAACAQNVAGQLREGTVSGTTARRPDAFSWPAPCLQGSALGERVVLKLLFSPPAQVCPLPPAVSHGDFVCHPRPCELYNHGTVVEFYCDPGYSLTSDYKYITCQYGEWFPSYQVYCIKSGEQGEGRAWPAGRVGLCAAAQGWALSSVPPPSLWRRSDRTADPGHRRPPARRVLPMLVLPAHRGVAASPGQVEVRAGEMEVPAMEAKA